MELEKEIKEQVDETLAKYAINSFDEVLSLCEEKNIKVQYIAKTINKDIPEIACMAYALGVAIAIKKETKLASYAAMDLGEGIQAFCMPGTEAYEDRAGLGHGYQASNYIKNNEEKEDDITDYSKELTFMNLTNDELLKITALLSKEIEKNV